MFHYYQRGSRGVKLLVDFLHTTFALGIKHNACWRTVGGSIIPLVI
jgi:hypothetical protein